MSKGLKFLIFFIILVFGIIVFVDYGKPKTINWQKTYGLNDKIPFGLAVFNKEAETLFKNQKIELFTKSPSDFFYQKGIIDEAHVDADDYEFETLNINEIDTNKKGTYFYVSNNLSLDNIGLNALLDYVSYGNNAFISVNQLPNYLIDSLKVSLKYDTKNTSNFNSVEGKNIFHFDKSVHFNYFDEFNQSDCKVLGSVIEDDQKQPNYIAVKHGKGYFYLHLQPLAFTNYYLLQKNYQYIENVVSFLPETGKMYWNVNPQKSIVTSDPLRFIKSQPPLKWALYLILIGIALFVLFNSKRKQRVVPEIPPVTNTTVDFTKTIGNLYYLEKNHADLTTKKIIYLLEKIRTEYLIDTSKIDTNFINKLQVKTGKPKSDITLLVNYINLHKSTNQNSEEALIELNKIIEKLNL